MEGEFVNIEPTDEITVSTDFDQIIVGELINEGSGTWEPDEKMSLDYLVNPTTRRRLKLMFIAHPMTLQQMKGDKRFIHISLDKVNPNFRVLKKWDEPSISTSVERTIERFRITKRTIAKTICWSIFVVGQIIHPSLLWALIILPLPTSAYRLVSRLFRRKLKNNT